jgi:hypothetical protein
VLVRVDAIPDRELEAAIRDIAVIARPDFSSWPPVRNFDVIVAIEDVDPRLRTGMSASARRSRMSSKADRRWPVR